jgi:magnesium chelatase family protein
LVDRLDISVDVQAVDHAALLNSRQAAEETVGSAELLGQVESARALQLERQGCLNGEMTAGQIALHCKPESSAEKLLLGYAQKHHLSARALHRICRVARTLADLEHEQQINKKHIATAIQYRKPLNGIR